MKIMIDYKTIQSAKNGNKGAINEIIRYYIPIIKKYSKDEDFIQQVVIHLIDGITKFRNKKI